MSRQRLPWAAWLVLATITGCASISGDHILWTEHSVNERTQTLFRLLNASPRLIRLDDAVLQFIDIRPPPHSQDSDASDVIFVHGIGGSMGDFAPQIYEMSRTRRVVALDLPGFGGSLREDHDYSIESYAEALGRFLELLEVRQAHLICHSLGGQICMAHLLSNPHRIRSLTLIDTAGVYDRAEFVRKITKRFGGVSLGRVRIKNEATPKRLTRSDKELFTRLVSDNSYQLALLESFEANFRQRVRDIDVPTLVVWGAQDPIFPVENAFFLLENLSSSCVHIVPEAGHLPQLSHPTPVQQWIDEHIKNTERGPR